MVLVAIAGIVLHFVGKQFQEAPPNDAATAQRSAFDMRAMDTNQDGYLAREEVSGTPQLLEEFVRADTNQDNRLSSQEVADYRAKQGLPPN